MEGKRHDKKLAEEAKETLITMNQQVKTFYDIGVAGLHRLIKHIDQIRQAIVEAWSDQHIDSEECVDTPQTPKPHVEKYMGKEMEMEMWLP